MLNLYTISTKSEVSKDFLSDSEKKSIQYHDIFDYPLGFSDLIKWTVGKSITNIKNNTSITSKNGFYYVEGHDGLVYKRALRKRISAKKVVIAKRAANLLSFIPSVKMIAITGSLAMNNSSDEGDIDLMIITQKGRLWTTRAFAYVLIHAFGLSARKPNDLQQKDKLCLNMWLDESDLMWKKSDRNLYTAHEIAQIAPLINKDKMYEKFIHQNKWILEFWPNAVRVRSTKYKVQSTKNLSTLYSVLDTWLESVAYKLQLRYMKSKISREVVTPTRALFHPQDWGKVVLRRLAS